MIRKVSTAGMTKEEWAALRSGTIGGSDAAAILGLSPYKSPYALWAEKTGKVVPEDISGKEAVRLGTDLEDYVARRFTEQTGKKVRRENATIFRDDMPFAHANYDRLIVGERAGLECKTTNALQLSKFKNGEFPATYYCQCVHYLMVSGLDRWYLAVLILGIGFQVFVIERDPGEIAALEAAEREFYRKMLEDEAPAIDGADSTLDTLNAEFPREDSGTEMDLTAWAGDLAILESCNQQIKSLEDRKAAAQARIMSALGETERGSFGAYAVSWKSQRRSTFDRKKWEREKGPIPEEYFKTSENRVFRFRKGE